MNASRAKRIRDLKKELVALEIEEKQDALYIKNLQLHAGDCLKRETALRKLLFRKVTGHGEHHHSQSCGKCKKLRMEIATMQKALSH